ncbi:MAG: hypothetical protein M1391_17295 [Bacteroidetes bacterium]|nr:hypothetical protein [Bacteroidota bacterium]
MTYYFTILTLHIVFAGIWLVGLFSDPILRGFIVKNRNKIGEKKFIHLYLTLVNFFGMVGSIGILITGITMVSLSSDYGFFQMNGNHWLTAKQILMVAILVLIGAFLIPTAKKIRAAMGEDLESNSPISDEGYTNLNKLFKITTAINVMVAINFLFAITHRYFFS